MATTLIGAIKTNAKRWLWLFIPWVLTELGKERVFSWANRKVDEGAAPVMRHIADASGWATDNPIVLFVLFVALYCLGVVAHAQIITYGWQHGLTFWKTREPGNAAPPIANARDLARIGVVAKNHLAGVLIGVTQSFDTIRCYTCTVSILDIRKMDGGQPHSVPELHDRDGVFRFKGVRLKIAGRSEELFYQTECQWWLTEGSNSTPRITYGSPTNDTTPPSTGQITLTKGTWFVSLEVTLTYPGKNLSVKKDVTFLWDGTKTPYVVD